MTNGGEIDKLFISIGLDTSELESALSGVSSKFESIGADTAGAFNDVGDAWARSVEPAIGAFDGIGAAAEEAASASVQAAEKADFAWGTAAGGAKKFKAGLADLGQTISTVVLGLSTVPGLMTDGEKAMAGMAVAGIGVGTALMTATKSIPELIIGFEKMGGAMATLNAESMAAALTNPWLLAAAAIGAVVAVLALSETKTHAVANAWAELSRNIQVVGADAAGVFEVLNKDANDLMDNVNNALHLDPNYKSYYEEQGAAMTQASAATKEQGEYLAKYKDIIGATNAEWAKILPTIEGDTAGVKAFVDAHDALDKAKSEVEKLEGEYNNLKSSLDALTGAQTDSATASDLVAQAIQKEQTARTAYDTLMKTASTTVKNYFDKYQKQAEGSKEQTDMVTNATKTLGKDGAAAFFDLIDAHLKLQTALGETKTTTDHAVQAANDLKIAEGKVASEGGVKGLQKQMDDLTGEILIVDAAIKTATSDFKKFGDLKISPQININTGTGTGTVPGTGTPTTGQPGTGTNSVIDPSTGLPYGTTLSSPIGLGNINHVPSTYDQQQADALAQYESNLANQNAPPDILNPNSTNYDWKATGTKNGVATYRDTATPTTFYESPSTGFRDAGPQPETPHPTEYNSGPGGIPWDGKTGNTNDIKIRLVLPTGAETYGTVDQATQLLKQGAKVASTSLSDYQQAIAKTTDSVKSASPIIQKEITAQTTAQTAGVTEQARVVTKGAAGITDQYSQLSNQSLKTTQGMALGVTGSVSGMGNDVTKTFDLIAAQVANSLNSLKSAASSCAGGLCGSTTTPLAEAFTDVSGSGTTNTPIPAGGFIATQTSGKVAPVVNAPFTISNININKQSDADRLLAQMQNARRTAMTQAGM